MAHVNIYLDDELLEKVRRAANIENSSLSGFVRERLRESLQETNDWPEGYFDNVIGSLSDSDLERPEQPDFESDSRREAL